MVAVEVLLLLMLWMFMYSKSMSYVTSVREGQIYGKTEKGRTQFDYPLIVAIIVLISFSITYLDSLGKQRRRCLVNETNNVLWENPYPMKLR